ncbi:geopeptide radical SAM maturase [Geobacter sp. SVR]|uniref:geopeptide radical SAM maturase n=1 Tax=Geobacter sp. SVR TaxID=2495594 RepID=UPI00143F0422|nr:geopeptide radical SAM maturase [Geobacter sp. SVR]BCS52005.1 radical SAM/SPASM domain-containing protein [Geobacter sp. SVR]GCF87181.1 radical SAM/SPASM domain-containing protein [Geobacter sp. SVR]
MELSRYTKTYPHPDQPERVLLFSTRRGALLQVSHALLERIRCNDLSDKERDTLLRLGFLVADCEAEREEVLATFTRVNRDSRRFTAVVTLTLTCNLACPYCYEDPFRGDFTMSEETADLLVQRVTERMASGLDIVIDFYGGEALLALPLLKSIAERLKLLAGQHGVAFEFNLVTNGTLLNRPTVRELAELGLKKAKLTLDGPREIHDRQRPFVSGRGSFDAIVANIAATWDLVALQVGGNFTRDNYHRFPEMLDHLSGAGITPDMLQMVVFAPVTPKSDGSGIGDFSATCACSSEPWLIEASLYLREETLRRGFNAPKPAPAGCMIEFANDLVVGYDGGLYKCPAFMGQEELRIGSLAEGVGDYRTSHGLDAWKCDECLACPYLPLCFGGCRFLRRLASGAIDGVDCRREFFDKTLEKMIRQDLELRAPRK